MYTYSKVKAPCAFIGSQYVENILRKLGKIEIMENETCATSQLSVMGFDESAVCQNSLNNSRKAQALESFANLKIIFQKVTTNEHKIIKKSMNFQLISSTHHDDLHFYCTSGRTTQYYVIT
jgi:hypothetical protein